MKHHLLITWESNCWWNLLGNSETYYFFLLAIRLTMIIL